MAVTRLLRPALADPTRHRLFIALVRPDSQLQRLINSPISTVFVIQFASSQRRVYVMPCAGLMGCIMAATGVAFSFPLLFRYCLFV